MWPQAEIPLNTLCYRVYTTRQELTDLVQEFQATGQMPEALVTILDKIISGVASRYGFWHDLEDRKQEFQLLVLKKVNNIKTTGNVFNYLTTCALNVLRAKDKRRPTTFTDAELEAEMV